MPEPAEQAPATDVAPDTTPPPPPPPPPPIDVLESTPPPPVLEAPPPGVIQEEARHTARRAAKPRRDRNCPANYPDCTVDVHYGTSRTPERDADAGEPNDYYGRHDGQRLELGTLKVSFPSGHVSGKIERPKVYKFEFSEDPEHHVMIVKLEPDLEEAEWLQRVKARGRDEAFVFVHGYNTRFAAAAWRAAQIAYDLDFAGVPMMYSWPSVGGGLKGLAAYPVDEKMVQTAVPHFRRFLKLVADRAGLESVHVIAHSMGNRLVTTALDEMCRQDQQPPLISQLVLAAPDVDTRLFQERFLDTLPRLARRVTIYASSKDKALKASKLAHGLQSGGIAFEPRLGDAENDLLWAFEGVERIDASFIADTLDSGEESKVGFLQHSYFANNNSVSSDLLCLLRHHSRRPLLVPRDGAKAAWNLKPLDVDRSACGEPLAVSKTATCAQLFERRSTPVPDLLGLALEQAREALLAAELNAGAVQSEPSRATRGTVIRQAPDAGEQVGPGSQVALWIAGPGGSISWWWLLLLLPLGALTLLAVQLKRRRA